MSNIAISIKPKTGKGNKYFVEIDVTKFEKLAASFGFFGDGFLKSLARAEKDFANGKIREIKSLSEIAN